MFISFCFILEIFEIQKKQNEIFYMVYFSIMQVKENISKYFLLVNRLLEMNNEMLLIIP